MKQYFVIILFVCVHAVSTWAATPTSVGTQKLTVTNNLVLASGVVETRGQAGMALSSDILIR